MHRGGGMHRLAPGMGLALLVAAAGCDYPELKRKVAQQEREIVDLRALTDRLTMQLTAARADKGRARADLERAEGSPGRPPSPTTSPTLETLRARLASNLAGSGAAVAVRGNSLVIVAPSLFESGKTALTARGKAVLKKIAAAARAHCPSYEVGVAGHTDSTPIGKNATKRLYPTNWHLSGARALAALDYLTGSCGIRPSQIHFRGYGQHHPVASNATAKGRAANRRIEIILEPPG